MAHPWCHMNMSYTSLWVTCVQFFFLNLLPPKQSYTLTITCKLENMVYSNTETYLYNIIVVTTSDSPMQILSICFYPIKVNFYFAEPINQS